MLAYLGPRGWGTEAGSRWQGLLIALAAGTLCCDGNDLDLLWPCQSLVHAYWATGRCPMHLWNFLYYWILMYFNINLNGHMQLTATTLDGTKANKLRPLNFVQSQAKEMQIPARRMCQATERMELPGAEQPGPKPTCFPVRTFHLRREMGIHFLQNIWKGNDSVVIIVNSELLQWLIAVLWITITIVRTTFYAELST